MNITVIGTGYVGLVAGAGLAHFGHDVVCLDVDEEKIRTLNEGRIPIHEPGLEDLVRTNREAERLRFTTDSPAAIRHGRVILIAVGTPADEDGSADLRHVLKVADSIGEHMDREKIVLTKSTVPVGTAEQVRRAIQARTDIPAHVGSNPEFLKEGAAVGDFMKPNRIVLGLDDPDAAEEVCELYEPFVRTGNEIMVMGVEAAEITKYAANAMLATRISFMNMIAGLSEATGANVDEIRHGIGSDPRIGPSFLFPGCGFGGSCFPKDLRALASTLKEHAVPSGILDEVIQMNGQQKKRPARTVLGHFKGDLAGKRIAVWGLAFKPNTDDMREAPSLDTIAALLEAGAEIVAHDPVALDEARARHFGNSIEYAGDQYGALGGADALVIHTEWHPYRRPDFERMRGLMRGRLVVDGRNLYDPVRMQAHGFDYHSIGRPPVVGKVTDWDLARTR